MMMNDEERTGSAAAVLSGCKLQNCSNWASRAVPWQLGQPTFECWSLRQIKKPMLVCPALVAPRNCRNTSWQAGALLPAHSLARALSCFTVPDGLFPSFGLV